MKRLTILVLSCLLFAAPSAFASETVETVDPGTTPDEFLYTFDKFFEELQLMFAADSEEEAALLLEFAKERLAEAELMTAEEKEEFIQVAMTDYLNTINQVEEKLAEAILENNMDEETAEAISEELDQATEVNEEVSSSLPEEVQADLEEKTEQLKVVANVVSGLDQVKVLEFYEQGMGFGQIAQAFFLAEAAGKDVSEVAALFTGEDIGFGEVAKQLGFHPSELKGKKRTKASVEQDVEEEQSEETSTEESGTESDATTEEVTEENAVTEATDSNDAQVTTASIEEAVVEQVSEKQTVVSAKAAEQAKKAAEKQKEAAEKAAEKQKEVNKKAEEKQGKDKKAKEQDDKED